MSTWRGENEYPSNRPLRARSNGGGVMMGGHAEEICLMENEEAKNNRGRKREEGDQRHPTSFGLFKLVSDVRHCYFTRAPERRRHKQRK